MLKVTLREPALQLYRRTHAGATEREWGSWQDKGRRPRRRSGLQPELEDRSPLPRKR